MTERQAWRRRLPVVAYGVGAVGLVGLCVVVGTNSLQDNDAYGSIVSALAALGTAFVAVVVHLRRGGRVPRPEDAEFVATLLAYWEPELRNRRTNPSGEPRTIPLTWEEADARFGAVPAAVVGTRAGEVRLKLGGRLAENPDAAARTLAEGFDRLPGSKRLVVLGEPGAGKTFLAITLTVGLLRRWSPGEPVAVFLSLASWDPIVESLDDWMVREIASLYHGGRVETAEDLLLRRRILPVLDGLDELPEHARRLAVTRINRTLDGDRPIVLTCRTTEYDEGLAGGAPVLLRAAVVRVRPLTVDDIVAHLATDPAWDELRNHVEAHRDGPVAEALATPLMLSLFGSIYDGTGPDDLLDEPLATRHEVEDYLVDRLLDTAYPATPVRRGGWTAKKARRWLTFLARHLHEKRNRDLSPWRLAHDVLETGLIPAIGAVALCCYLLYGDGDALVTVSMAGVLCAAAVIASARRVPGRDAFDAKHEAETFRYGVNTGTSVVLTLGFAFFLLDFLTTSRDYGDITDLVALTAASAAFALVTGLGFGLNELMVATLLARGDAKVGGREFLIRDRSSALRAMVLTTAFVAMVAVPAATVAAALGSYLGQRVAVVAGVDAVVDMRLPALGSYVPWELSLFGRDGLVVTSLWFAAVFALAVLATRTWTWLPVLRVTHALARKLPWRLMAFLEDGRKRGLLRGSGGYYQFGHIRLQERLVATAVETKDRPVGRKVKVVVASAAVVVLLAGLVSTWVAAPAGCRDLGSAAVDQRMTSVVTQGETGCFAIVDDADWAVLRDLSADPARVGALDALQATTDDVSAAVYLVGELDRLSSARWDNLLDGVFAAGEVGGESLRVVFVHADVGSTRDAEAALLTADYVRSMVADVSSQGVVNLDIGDTLLNAGRPPVVGLKSGDLDEVVRKRAADDVDTWLEASLSPLPTRALADGVSEEECRALSPSDTPYAGNFDLRGVRNAVELMADIGNCGPPDVLVDHAVARSIDVGAHGFQGVNVLRTEDVGETIRPACEEKLRPVSRPGAVAACVAVVAAVRLTTSLVRSPAV